MDANGQQNGLEDGELGEEEIEDDDDDDEALTGTSGPVEIRRGSGTAAPVEIRRESGAAAPFEIRRGTRTPRASRSRRGRDDENESVDETSVYVRDRNRSRSPIDDQGKRDD